MGANLSNKIHLVDYLETNLIFQVLIILKKYLTINLKIGAKLGIVFFGHL